MELPTTEVEQVRHAGRLRFYLNEWKQISNDPWILNCIKGYKIPFIRRPVQKSMPKQCQLSQLEENAMSIAIDKLIALGAVECVAHEESEFISPIFLVPKKDGSHRFILNLKRLNSFLDAPHFKMEDIRTAISLVRKDSYMATIDLKDAYFLIPIHESDRKYLKFLWKGQRYQFTCLPFGLSIAPYVFTKVLKPVVSYLRQRSILLVTYIDDWLFLASSDSGCRKTGNIIMEFLTKLGFTINHEKSKLNPGTKVEYLGLAIDSHNFEISVPEARAIKTVAKIKAIMKYDYCDIREFASLIGSLVSMRYGVNYSLLYTRNLEVCKSMALLKANGDYDSEMRISSLAMEDLKWWLSALPNCKSPIRRDNFHLTIYTDSSLTGWGAVSSGVSARGFWSHSEQKEDINFLELLAVFIALKCFAKECINSQILLRVDNTTAISYINRMGGTKVPKLHALAKEIWEWCSARNFWIFASYIPSAKNFEADKASRNLNKEYEWELNPKYFKMICNKWGRPCIDLFASRLNRKCKNYIAWFPDPEAIAIDAFTISWTETFFYSFPPFSLISRTIVKIDMDNAHGVIVVPIWPNQPWFPLIQNRAKDCIIFRPSSDLLISPFRDVHKLYQSLSLGAFLL